MATRRSHFATLIAALALTTIPFAPASPPMRTRSQQEGGHRLYDAAINRRNYEAAAKFLGAHYKQHNPTAHDGAEGLKGFVDF